MVGKGSKIEDPDYLAMLAAAREKANAVRKQKSEEKKKIKLAKDLEHQKALKEAEDKLSTFTTSSEVEKKTNKKQTKKEPPPPKEEHSETDESEYESDDESEEEEEIHYEPKAKSKPKAIPKPVKQSKPIHRSESMPPVGKPQYTLEQIRLMRAYQSLFDC